MSEKYKPTPENLQERPAGDIAVLVATMVINNSNKEILVSKCQISDLTNAEKSNWAMLHHGGIADTCNN